MTERQSFWMTVAIVAAVAFLSAAAFSAYLRPAMLMEFANLILCQ